MKDYKYQHDFSAAHHEAMHDALGREQKANKMIAVLDDYFSGKLDTLTLLDVGCSTGIIANILSTRFKKVVGTDIDARAIKYATEHFSSQKLEFRIQDSMDIAYPDNSFDVIICAQVYEHVPDSRKLLSEIHRVLKPGGVCYFAAGNRLKFMEEHYKLPLLSIIPKPLAHLYLRILRRGDFYYENHLTLWGLRALVSQFAVIDYTRKIVSNPQKYHATEMIQQGSITQKLAIWVLKMAYWLFPTYIWLLKKIEQE
jgi:2-polyprenyl-3-methyl-5-hydroxy-6-metoxy-1,4-benzoquinol methylase